VGESFFNLADRWGTTVRQSADVYGALPISQAHASLLSGPAGAVLPRGWRRLDISNLNFTYEDERTRTHHLHGVSLTLERGKAIALVGASGSGKSTLLAVLRGLHQARGASVQCDGEPLAHGLHALAHATTLFPQEPEIFSDSVRFNVAFGFEAEDERIREALARARFTPVLERLPNGLDTNVAERGVNLSGGERQRLALARGLFFADKSEVLLLDEATSSVDAVNEQLIYQRLKAGCAGRCLDATIHKLHLLAHFDVVYFIDDGRIVASGTPDELKARAPAFRQMWEASAAAG
jgi:ABC-type multidrug transport system fused ATPase/permease subunit